jgi:hypothetical protein
MNCRQFWNTVKEAYGCEAPSMGCLFIEEAGDRLVYDCWLIDHDIKVSVPFPKQVVRAWEAAEGRDPNAYRTVRVKTVEMFLYALAKLEKLPDNVKAHMQMRFGYVLNPCQEYARKAWKEIEDFDTKSWAGSS